jgi:hypothetical protein
MKITKVLASIVYGLLGIILLVVGAIVLLFKTGLLPDTAKNAILSEAGGNLHTLHIVQELGTVFVFVGLITFWFARHYDQSLFFHWAMTAFLGLLALVHWFDVRGPNSSFTEPIPVTIPFLVFAAIGVLRLTTERARARA